VQKANSEDNRRQCEHSSQRDRKNRICRFQGRDFRLTDVAEEVVKKLLA